MSRTLYISSSEPIILLILTALLVETLRMTKVSIPGYKLKGEMATLECEHELEGEVLYAIKWYKDNEEFYRFVPKSNPPQHSYNVDGINVDHQLSDSQRIVLKKVTLKSSGLYRCEISAEAPSFSSAQGEGRMDVVYLPEDGPNITGEEKKYQSGDEIILNCTSGRSYPASALRWYVNEKQILNGKHLIEYPTLVHSQGLLTTILGLRLNLTNDHFEKGHMRVKCVASVSLVLWQGNKESLVRQTAPLIDNREAYFLVKGSSYAKVPSLVGLLTSLAVLFLSSR